MIIRVPARILYLTESTKDRIQQPANGQVSADRQSEEDPFSNT